MEQLALHIEYLLRRNDCVILPGIGAFINAYIPARFDDVHNVWIPMHREIRFNQAVNQDDGLLANSYARKYSLPFHEARAVLDSDLKYLLRLLNEEGEVSVGRIGSLQITEENNIAYNPFLTSADGERELGFIPVALVNSSTILPNSIKKETGFTDNSDRNSLDLISTVAETNRKFNTDKNYYIPINKIFAKVAASVIVICLVALCTLFNTDERLKEDRASILPVDTTASAVSKQIVEKASSATSAPDASVNNESDNSAQESMPGKADKSEKITAKRFHLIIGTFRSDTEAVRYIASLKEKGQDAEIISSNTLYRVALSSSDDKSELIKLLNSAEVRNEYDGAWIYEDKSII